MATTASQVRTAEVTRPKDNPRPITIWAVIGVIFVTIQIVAFTGWIVSGNAKAIPTGPDPVPTWMKWTTHGAEVVGFPLMGLFLYRYLIQPWRREGRITSDGLLILAMFTTIWQDTLINIIQPVFLWNGEFLNLGVWNPWIPGWISPNGERNGEPLVFIVQVYVFCCYGMAVLGSWFMRKVRDRAPTISNFRLVAACFLFHTVLNLIWEPLLGIRLLGFWSYPSGIEWLTLFHGERYQWPVYLGIFWGTWATSISCLRYFTNDKGLTVAEHGADKMGLRPRRTSVVRFLALAGALNACFIIAYDIPVALTGLYASEWPEEIVQNSYWSHGICGPGTKYHCPGPGVPIPRPDSARLGPDDQGVRGGGTE